MNTIITIIKKEIIGTLRDKRTLISAIIIPALFVPLVMLGITKLQKGLIDKESNKELKVVLYNAPPPIAQLFNDPKFKIINNVPMAKAKDSVAHEDFDAILDFDGAFLQNIDSLQAGKLSFYYKSTNIMVEKRVMEKLDQYKASVLSSRFKKLSLSEELLSPLAINNVDVASAKEQIGLMVGGFLRIFLLSSAL